MSKKKLLIINKIQFGYITDYYKYCEYLNSRYKIKYVCFDTGLKKVFMDGVLIKYISHKGFKLFKGIRYVFANLKIIRDFNGITMVHYFPGCSFLKIIFFKKKMIVDVRTFNVSKNNLKRKFYNWILIKELHFFNHVSIISKGLALKTKLKKISILPLGSDVISKVKKNYKNLNLLYVGTLVDRNIIESVKGVRHFLNKMDYKIKYDIIGGGDELDEIKKYITQNNLDNIVTLHGSLFRSELKPFFDKCNVGVSFVPMYSYFDLQPPTKTFEYCMSGLYCVATSTSENNRIITSKNGILIKDDSNSFSDALEQLTINNKFIKEQEVRDSLSEYNWNSIVNNKLDKILKSL